jgi:hypothetical protein
MKEREICERERERERKRAEEYYGLHCAQFLSYIYNTNVPIYRV